MNSVASSSLSCATDHCVTCSDEGVPMAVVRVNERAGLALCADGEGMRATVETALVESLAPGDRVLVHAGVAIATLPARELAPSPQQSIARLLQSAPASMSEVAT